MYGIWGVGSTLLLGNWLLSWYILFSIILTLLDIFPIITIGIIQQVLIVSGYWATVYNDKQLIEA